jgi:hypothetical protein
MAGGLSGRGRFCELEELGSNPHVRAGRRIGEITKWFNCMKGKQSVLRLDIRGAQVYKVPIVQ